MATRSPPIPTRSLHRSPAENRLPGWHRRVRGGCSRGASCSIMEAPGLYDPARHTTAQHAKRSVHAKKRARGGVMQLELQGRDRRRDRVVPVGQLQGFPRHGHPPREPRLPPRACSPAGWLFGAPKSTFLTSNRPPEAISDRSLRGSQNGMSRMRCPCRFRRESPADGAQVVICACKLSSELHISHHSR